MKPSTLTIDRRLRGVISHHLGKSAFSSCLYHLCGCKLSVRWLFSFRSVMRVVVLVLRPPGLSVFVLHGLHVPVHTNSTCSIASETYRAAVLERLLPRCNETIRALRVSAIKQHTVPSSHVAIYVFSCLLVSSRADSIFAGVSH